MFGRLDRRIPTQRFVETVVPCSDLDVVGTFRQSDVRRATFSGRRFAVYLACRLVGAFDFRAYTGGMSREST